MKRRAFIAATGALTTLPLQPFAQRDEIPQADDRHFFELLIYHTHVGSWLPLPGCRG